MDDDVFDQYEGMYNPYEREFDDQSHFEVRLRFSRFFFPTKKSDKWHCLEHTAKDQAILSQNRSDQIQLWIAKSRIT